ncbi:MAG: transcription antitermination factor NusB, partial [Actinomycetota bacterium]
AVLGRVRGGAYTDRALAGEARRRRLDGRDRALAHRLAFGAVQRQRTLDHLVDGILDRPGAVEAEVRDVLRLGAYELLFSDGVPPHAVVDQAVRLARAGGTDPRRATGRAGLVNAVLRRVAAEGRARLAALRDDDPASAAVCHSFPDWIAERLFAALGAERARAEMAAANLPAESAVRWNPLRGPRRSLEDELPAGWHRDPLLPEAYVVAGRFALEDSRAWARGRAIGQSRASMIPARALAPRPGERILDMCAAPGAKATHIAALAQNRCRITAVELHPARADALRALARRMGALVQVVDGDAREVPLDPPYDAVLVDPPCTGLGVLSARPDARWRRRETALAPLVDIQRGLLARALELVRPGGRVVYSTCTLLPEENEDVVRGTGAHVDDLTGDFPGMAHPALPGALLTLPSVHGTDGFFVARLAPGGR